MLEVEAENYRCLRRLSFRTAPSEKLSIIVGNNENGKSTFISLFKFAFTGEAFGYKGQTLSGLLSHGTAGGLKVSITIDDLSVRRTLTTGDSLKSIANRLGVTPEVLPLLFDAKMCGDGGNKHFRAFLASAGSSRFDALAYFADDPQVKPYLDQAFRTGKSETKGQISFCESMRAAQKAPPQPVRPSVALPSEAEIGELAAEVQALDTAISAKQAECADAAATVQALHAIIAHQEAQQRYAAALASATGDALGARRAPLQALSAANLGSIDGYILLIEKAGVSVPESVRQAKADLEQVVAAAKQQLISCPPPTSVPPAPVLPAHATSIHDKLSAAGRLTGVRDLLATVSRALTALQESLQKLQETRVEKARRHEELLRASGAWRAYEEAYPAWEAACLKSEEEWKRWDYAAKAVAAANEEYLHKVGNEFTKLVGMFSTTILQGRQVEIDPDKGLTLAGVQVEDLSVSTQWRIEVAVMAAIAVLLKSPILLIDGADVLDPINRATMTHFLMSTVVPRFSHVVLTSTVSGRLEDEKPLPPSLTSAGKWILSGGELTPVR